MIDYMEYFFKQNSTSQKYHKIKKNIKILTAKNYSFNALCKIKIIKINNLTL